MAKKNNKALLVVGLAAAGVGLYLLTRKPATTTTTTATVLPPANPATSSSNTLASILTAGASIVKSIFGSSGTYAPLAPVNLAPTAGPVNSPAAGINYINPSAPNIFLPPAPSGDTAGGGDTGDWNYDIFG